jgi:hypothetical protein
LNSSFNQVARRLKGETEMKQSPQANIGVDARGKPLMGLKSGTMSELCMFYKVKPGQEAAVRDAIYSFCNDPRRDVSSPQGQAAAAKIGIHEMRFCLFDNDTRLAWFTSFDTDWDTYIDDTIALAGTVVYGNVIQHLVGAPEGIEKPDFPNASNVFKDLFNAARVTASGFLPTNNELTVADQNRDRAIREAFKASLNEPGAAEALKHPALKRLLDLAAD